MDRRPPSGIGRGMARFIIHFESPIRNAEEGRHVPLQDTVEAFDEANARCLFKEFDSEGCTIFEVERCEGPTARYRIVRAIDRIEDAVCVVSWSIRQTLRRIRQRLTEDL